MKIYLTMALVLSVLQFDLVNSKCYIGIKRMKYTTDDCSGDGEIDKEYTQTEIENMNSCGNDGASNWALFECEKNGMYKSTYSDSDCSTLKEKKLQFQWAVCDGKKMWTSAVHI